MPHVEAGFHQRQTSHLAAGAAAAAAVLGLSIVIGQMPSSGGSAAPTAPVESAPTPSPDAQPTTTATQIAQAGSGYKDGTFQADAGYRVEGHQEQISVKVSLQNGNIEAVSVVNSESNGTSAFYQQRFVQAFQAKVVGRPIADLKLPVIAGASKTTAGFNQAIDKIRQAAAIR